jgi:hypothetical protein
LAQGIAVTWRNERRVGVCDIVQSLKRVV